jgi:hypothetical protein
MMHIFNDEIKICPSEFESLVPFERDILMGLTLQKLEKREQERQKLKS